MKLAHVKTILTQPFHREFVMRLTQVSSANAFTLSLMLGIRSSMVSNNIEPHNLSQYRHLHWLIRVSVALKAKVTRSNRVGKSGICAIPRIRSATLGKRRVHASPLVIDIGTIGPGTF
jgi:hypothetical protein